MKVAIYLLIAFLPSCLIAQHTGKKSDHVNSKAVTLEKDWVTHPPEYASFQQYKDQVLVPEQIAIGYKLEPVESSKVVGDIVPYGEAMHPLLKVKGSHNGIDFRAVPGVAVSATADGIVQLVKTDHEKYGQYIIIKHTDRTSSLYAHLSNIKVEKGQLVKQGQAIGAVGMSGKASYPHLHYELHVNKQTVNPILETRPSKNKILDNDSQLTLRSPRKEASPLYVIDGEVQENNFAIEQINPDDVEMLQVLKGDAAIAKYGEAASYGVVEIELKKPIVTSPKKNPLSPSAQMVLEQNAPNPVNDFTKISFYLPSSNPASLLFYNQAGEFVYSKKQGFTEGFNEILVSASDLKVNGVVYYFLIQDNMTQVKKMVVVQ